MSNRIEYFDILRAFAIFGVVAIHSSGTGLHFSDDSINFNFTVIWRNLLNFSVPMFLAISGFFLAKKRIECYRDYFVFLKKQIPRVYIPLLTWSLVWFALAVLVQHKSVVHELIKVVVFQSSGPYYFIALIIQYYLLLPILKSFANKKGVVLSLIISIAMTSTIFYLRYYTDINLPLIVYAGNFATWLMFFVLGLYLGSSTKIEISNRLLIVLIVSCYILSCFESYVLISMFHQVGDAVTAVKPSSFLYSFVLIIFLFKNQNWIRSKPLKNIGEMSFGIYLIHMFILTGITILISRIYPSLTEISPVYQFVLISVVMLFCSLFISAFNNIFTAKQSKLVGFK
ncbi:acyltransferase [Sulfurovum mangrovi]|uniref:acyltransferase n=1 Tax=Sulfurovum mangrovi TaxID=2893889 RepID=UPI001E63EF9D|nr:acyltransferase [Sulfurovum mangrovi]UFH58514.1 acyltransferase [Sulfurovum mangrovi]